jgi:dihydrolipoamide dehydrogenase
MSYDLVIIGGGPAGYTAATRAGELGLKTAVVEKTPRLGGTCLNVGCIPSKALLASSEHYHYAKHRLSKHGITAKDVSIDIPAMMKRKDEIVDGLGKGIEFLFKKHKVDRFTGTGKLLGGGKVQVEGKDSAVLEARNILIATGSSVVELPFLKFDGDRVISSDHAIALSEAPKSLLVIGAGAIGLELGSVWARLGSEVTVVEFLPRIAVGFDLEVAAALQKSLEKQGLKFHLGTKVQSAEVGKKGVKLAAEKDGKPIAFEAEKVLVAVGRKPFAEGLGLEAAGVKLTDRGRIAVDGSGQTSAPGIWAVGDVTDGPMLAHKAEAEGTALVERLAGKGARVNYNVIPGVIYTSPEAASVGQTEEQLKEKGAAYKVGKYNYLANARAKAGDMTEGFAKVLADAKTDRVLGVHLLAGNASELIAEAGVLMEFSGSAEDLARTIHAHPTMSEVMKEAAHAAYAAH